MQIDKKSWLRRAEIFAALDERELGLIEGYSGIVSHREGDTIISEGDRGGVLYILVSVGRGYTHC